MSLFLTDATIIDGTGRDPVAGGFAIDGTQIDAVGPVTPSPDATACSR